MRNVRREGNREEKRGWRRWKCGKRNMSLRVEVREVESVRREV